MLTEIHLTAPAKVNFGLKVLPPRSDGFHNIESIFQSVSLCDEIAVQVTRGERFCSVSCGEMMLPAENTVTLAYRAFCEVVPECVCAVSVELAKHIPAGGGLGGGSSDAAAFVR